MQFYQQHNPDKLKDVRHNPTPHTLCAPGSVGHPEAATQGFAAQSLISALSGLHNYNKSFDTQFALTVRGKKAVFVNCYYPTMDDKHRESACTPLSRDTDEIKAEIGWIQDKLGQTPQYEPRCSEVLKQLREPIAA